MLYQTRIVVPKLSSQEELKLWYKAKAGCEKSREILILRFYKLVCHCAKKFKKHRKIPLEDLINQGNLILIENLLKWPCKGNLGNYLATAITFKLIDYIYSAEHGGILVERGRVGKFNRRTKKNFDCIEDKQETRNYCLMDLVEITELKKYGKTFRTYFNTQYGVMTLKEIRTKFSLWNNSLQKIPLLIKEIQDELQNCSD